MTSFETIQVKALVKPQRHRQRGRLKQLFLKSRVSSGSRECRMDHGAARFFIFLSQFWLGCCGGVVVGVAAQLLQGVEWWWLSWEKKSVRSHLPPLAMMRLLSSFVGWKEEKNDKILHQFTFANCMQQSLYSIILALTFPWSFVSDDKKEH